jgi:sucrose phosphorylase
VPAFYLNAFFATCNDTDAVNKKRSNRAINRHKWSKKALEKRLKSSNNIESLVFNSLKKLIYIRKCQPAFHPNATQVTLQLDCCFFGIWRRSIDLSQSIYAITNVTYLEQRLSLSSLNLAFSDRWFDLISGNEISSSASELSFNPYQTYWVSNERLCISEST